MRSILLLTALFISSAFAFGQVKQDRTVGDFSGIEVSGAFTVYLRMGEKSAVTVVADKEIIDRVTTEVDNDILEVELDQEWWDWAKDVDDIEVYITLSTVKSLEFSGACVVKGKNSLRGTAIEIEASGACKLEASFACNTLEMDFSGATKATLSGNCTKVILDASGASAIYAADLQTETTSMDVSGASKVEVWVTNTLSIEASGASKVLYKGDPPTITKDVSGASSISKM